MTMKFKSLVVTLCLMASPVSAAWATPMTAEQMFQILASEIGLQRGQANLAYQTYLSLARTTKDGELAKRAMEIAIAANSAEPALDAAKLWDEIDPSSAKEYLVTLLMLNEKWTEAIRPASELIKSKKTIAQKETLFNQWRPLLARAKDEDLSLEVFYQLAQPYFIQFSHNELLYAFALASEKVKKYDAMEKALKKILAKSPQDKNALNALGYSYADRGINLKEAHTLLTKAHQLEPEDSFILDSLAWANYRLGNKKLAIEQLQKAFATRPEAEIGAHLGEVLWQDKQTEAADQAWRNAEKIDANNKTLLETLKRLWPNRSPVPVKNIWEGRFSVKVGGQINEKGGSGAFTLSHDNQTDILDIRSPMGNALAKITVGPSGAKLEDGNRIQEAHDADSLMQAYLGLPLPARGLSNWLNGAVRTGSSAKIERDALYRAQTIEQDNWLIRYQWSNSHQLKKMDFYRESPQGPIEIKLVFESLDD